VFNRRQWFGDDADPFVRREVSFRRQEAGVVQGPRSRDSSRAVRGAHRTAVNYPQMPFAEISLDLAIEETKQNIHFQKKNKG
jgi:hypothetical protein